MLKACWKRVESNLKWLKLSFNINSTFPLLSKMLDRVEAVWTLRSTFVQDFPSICSTFVERMLVKCWNRLNGPVSYISFPITYSRHSSWFPLDSYNYIVVSGGDTRLLYPRGSCGSFSYRRKLFWRNQLAKTWWGQKQVKSILNYLPLFCKEFICKQTYNITIHYRHTIPDLQRITVDGDLRVFFFL